jgi:hypothetical protein
MQKRMHNILACAFIFLFLSSFHCSNGLKLMRKDEAGFITQIDPWGRDSVRVRIGIVFIYFILFYFFFAFLCFFLFFFLYIFLYFSLPFSFPFSFPFSLFIDILNRRSY